MMVPSRMLMLLLVATIAGGVSAEKLKTFLVFGKLPPAVHYEGGHGDYERTMPTGMDKLDAGSQKVARYRGRLLEVQDKVLQHARVGQTQELYRYTLFSNGFAVQATEEAAEMMRRHADVTAVVEDPVMQQMTDSTPRYLGISSRGGAWVNGYTGEGVVIGIVDGGIQPEHESFADVPTAMRGPWDSRKKAYQAPPSTFKGTGCSFGNKTYNEEDAEFKCNNKVVKANYFVKGWLAENRNKTLHEDEFMSARDYSGHGTHVGSTAAGNYGVRAIVDGKEMADGVLSGVAPRAHIAAYKICWRDQEKEGLCFGSDNLAALEEAAADGVDVINYSVGCIEKENCGVAFEGAFGFLAAVRNNVWAATSAGNSGPGLETLGYPGAAPWVTAVAATQDDQVFATVFTATTPAGVLEAPVMMTEGQGPVKLAEFGEGEGLTGKLAAADPWMGCEELTNPEALAGKIALISRGGCRFATKYDNAAAAGAVAVLVVNTEGRSITAMGGTGGVTLPGAMIQFEPGQALLKALQDGKEVAGLMSGVPSSQRDWRAAGFTSMGPNPDALDLLRPDIAAPGVGILAGSTTDTDHRGGKPFALLSGTSMASPHIAGVFALMKQARPEWTAAMARSALMTTARQGVKDTMVEDLATPFAVGAGVVDPLAMLEPGLVYDISFDEYLAFSCGTVVPYDPEACDRLKNEGYSTDAKQLNLPSITVANASFGTAVTVTRRVQSVNKETSMFKVEVKAPAGVAVRVVPDTLVVRAGETRSFDVTFVVKEAVPEAYGKWVYGSLLWRRVPMGTDDQCFQQTVRSDLVVRPVEAPEPSPCPASHPLSACGQCWTDVRQASWGGCGNYICPDSHPYRSCGQCWTDKEQAASDGCIHNVKA